MKRYLYILLGILMFAACEPQVTPEHDVTFCFGPVEVTTTDNSATIDVLKPYITVDDVKLEDVAISLEYYNEGDEVNITSVLEYTTSDIEGHICFEISGLEPETRYNARLVLDGGKYGSKRGEPFPVVTKEHIPTYSITYDGEVEAKGLMATIKLTNVAYLVDDQAQEISALTVEYARLLSEGMEWVSVEVDGTELKDGAVDVAIPANGADYLEELRNYLYRVTITPSDATLDAMTTDDVQFKTDYAEVTAEISTPELTIEGQMLNVNVESVKVYYDGLYLPTYLYCDYYIYYRKVGAKDWNEAEAETTERGMRLTVALLALEEGAEYEFAAVVVAGAMLKLRMSEKVTITTPKEPTPEPPAPPVEGGDSDTTAIAGDWHLTQWCGAEPSFDVYISISEDGVVTLWQRIESREWELYYSTVNYENDAISGTYTDGVAWSASYSVALGDNTMTWTDVNDTTDVSVYTRSELPDGLPTTVSQATRSEANERFL